MVHVSQYVARGGRHLSPPRISPAYVAYSLGSRVAPLLPRRASCTLADRIGDLAWLFNRRGRRAVRSNLHQVLGRTPTWRQVRGVFRHGARNYYDTFTIPSLTAEDILSLVAVDGWHHLDAALAAGKGAILLGVHLSSVALAGQAVAARGYRVTSVAERVEPPELNELLLRLRSGGGVRVLSLGPDLIKELLAVLRRNEIVGLVMDRDIAGTGVAVPFFGAQARLPSGAALLALRTGAVLLPAIAVRDSSDSFGGQLGPPIEPERGAHLRDSVARTTRRIAERFEQEIRAHPEQWTVFQPIWRLSVEADEV